MAFKPFALIFCLHIAVHHVANSTVLYVFILYSTVVLFPMASVADLSGTAHMEMVFFLFSFMSVTSVLISMFERLLDIFGALFLYTR
jgi:hypothetical protein